MGGFASLRKRFALAFERHLGQTVGRVGTSILWRNHHDKPQVLEMGCYQDGYRHNMSPKFFRAAVNFRPPARSLTGYWSERDEIDQLGPNANIEITVMPDEAGALARWLPHWLQYREGLTSDLPSPPKGLKTLPDWTPKLEHVYMWSEQADKAYLEWKGGDECRQA